MIDNLFVIGRLLYILPILYMAIRNFQQLDHLTELSREKGLPPFKAVVFGATCWLIVGLLGLVFDLMPLIAGFMAASFLIVSGVKVHNYWTVTDPHERNMERIQLEKNIALAGAALALARGEHTIG